MEHQIVIEGMEAVIERDLNQHRQLLIQTVAERDAYRLAVAHEVKKKKHYRGLIGKGKFDDAALHASMNEIGINIRHLSDKAHAAEEKIAHHQLIVDTLTAQLAEQRAGLAVLAKQRSQHAAGN